MDATIPIQDPFVGGRLLSTPSKSFGNKCGISGCERVALSASPYCWHHLLGQEAQDKEWRKKVRALLNQNSTLEWLNFTEVPFYQVSERVSFVEKVVRSSSFFA